MSALIPQRGAPADPCRALVVDLQSSLDLESTWKACLKLIESKLPHRSCSLMFNIVNYEPTDARHHVVLPRNPDYVPATSLTISGPYLARHPQIKLYTYSQIVSEDPDAHRRRLDQEPDPEWNEFIHLAFWHDSLPEAVLSIRRPPDQSHVTAEEHAFLEQLHPMIEAALRRLRAVEGERSRRLSYEHFLRQVPLTVMFVNAAGESLFANNEAEKQCGRWNRGLRSSVGSDACFRLPEAVGEMFECAERASAGKPVANEGQPASVRCPHPSLPRLSVKIDRNWQFSGLQMSPSYVVTFLDEPVGGEASPEASQAALLALQRLTPTERRVALLVAKGLRNHMIAEHLSRSRRTIEFQLNSIYRKLDISSRTELVRALS
ncbi:MAG TPA: helix-turn-helix transcriptional regulator [Solimonas sp.]|nr:helix-turn-helix transcriptional regulator [Solimonas sp.]